MASRRGPSHPGWENPPRLESFPRLRGRDERRANQPLLIVALCVALIFVALITFPILTSSRGSSGASPLGSGGSGLVAASATPTPTPSPTPGMSFRQYVVKSGDFMSSIAITFNLRLCELLAANPGVVPDHIELGMQINIPIPFSIGCATQAPKASATPGT